MIRFYSKMTKHMGLKEQINQDIKEAMKAKRQDELRALRAIKSAIMLAETDGSHDGALSQEEELALLTKAAKQRRDSLEVFEKQNRDDLAAKEKEELEVIERYLPQQLDAAALEEAIKAIIAQTGASSMKDMGKVMGVASKQLAGQAEGKAMSAVVRKLLG